MKPVVGFVGNSIGMTDPQRLALQDLLHSLDVDLIHHGNATGAEHDAHYMFLCSTEAQIHVHEPMAYYGRAVTNPIEPRVFAHPCDSALDSATRVTQLSDVVIVMPADMNAHQMKKLLGGVKKGQMQVYASIVCRTEPIVRTVANMNKKLIIIREDGSIVRYE